MVTVWMSSNAAVGMGTCVDVAYVLDSQVVLKCEVVDVEIAQKVSAGYFHQIGIQFGGHLRSASAGVEPEGFQIGIAYICGELVQRVVGFGRKIEYALEDEVEVGVGTDDLAVEGIVGISAGRRDAGVVVSEHSQAVHHQGIHPYESIAVVEDRLEPGVRGHLADEVLVDDASDAKIPGGDLAADFGSAAAVEQVLYSEVGVGGPVACAEPAFGREIVERALCPSAEVEGLPTCKLPDPDILPAQPACELSRAGRCEVQALDYGVQHHFIRDGYTGDAAVRISFDSSV